MYGGEVVWGGVGVVWFGANRDAKRGEGEGKVTLLGGGGGGFGLGRIELQKGVWAWGR